MKKKGMKETNKIKEGMERKEWRINGWNNEANHQHILESNGMQNIPTIK